MQSTENWIVGREGGGLWGMCGAITLAVGLSSRCFSCSINLDKIVIQEYSRQLPLACDLKWKHYK